jgi:MerR family transcriptional regulator, light-induced transcriptional regulator
MKLFFKRNGMKTFSIKDLERFSGIKAHTIRMWERRHRFPCSQRNGGDIRHYSLETARAFLDVALLNRNGYRISDLVSLSDPEVRTQVCRLRQDADQQARAIHRLILLMHECETEEFELVLDRCVHLWGIHTTIEQVVMPFLRKTPLLSGRDTSNEAHFAITAVRRKIILGLESIKVHPAGKTRALLFLPQGEHYDLVLLYLAYVLRSKGVRVMYLGTNISTANLLKVIEEKAPDRIYTYITAKRGRAISRIITALQSRLPAAKINVVVEDRALLDPARLQNISIVPIQHLAQIPGE